MLFIAVTRQRIANNFQSFDVREFEINSFIVTVVIDKFMSRLIPKANGFSIIELLNNLPNFEDAIFSQIEYNKNSESIEIFKPTISGRPIYYHINSEGHFFCSTHISMLRKAGVIIKENTDAIPEFFTYHYVAPPQTFYKNIYQMLIGERLQVSLSKERCEISKIGMYNPPRLDSRLKDINKISDSIIDILSGVFKTLAAHKDRVSVALSGGLDSSILYKVCENTLGTKSTFSAGYPFAGTNERIEDNLEKKYAFSAAAVFGADHKYYHSTTKDYMSGFINAIAVNEEPYELPQFPLIYATFKEGIPKAKDVLILGPGADSIAGLNNFYFSQSIDFKYKVLKSRLGDRLDDFVFRGYKPEDNLLSKNTFLKLVEAASLMISDEKKPTLDMINYLNSRYLPLSDPDNLIWSLGTNGSENWVCNYFNVTRDKIIERRYSSVVSKFENRSFDEVIGILALFCKTPFTQAVWSKIGESNYRIAYFPYYSSDLLDFMNSIPLDIKIGEPKNVLRSVARKLGIPEFIITRPKSGFGVSPDYWLQKGGIFEPLVILSSKAFDRDQIQYMRTDTEKRENIFKKMTFWSILNYSIWKRLFINNESPEALLGELDEATKATEANSLKYK